VQRGPRINRQIRISPIRLIGEDGEQVGIVETLDALQMADEQGLDLVEVSPEARPPVCKLMDYGKFKYEAARSDREKKKNATDNTPKEIRFRPNTDQHDLDTKLNQARKFLEEGNKVRLTVRFRGAEMRRMDVGRDTLRQVTDALKDTGKLESPIPDVQGRMISVTVAPAKAP
jgi:translation initiation factor IF-3